MQINQVIQQLQSIIPQEDNRQNSSDRFSLSDEQCSTILKILNDAHLENVSDRCQLIASMQENSHISAYVHRVIGINGAENVLQTFDQELTAEILSKLIACKNNNDAIANWTQKYESYFEGSQIDENNLFDLVQTLSKLDQNGLETCEKFISALPEREQSAIKLLHNRKSLKSQGPGQVWSDIKSSNEDDRFILLSHYISAKNVPIVKFYLSDHELSQLAPCLRYGNFEGCPDKTTQKLLEKGSKLKTVLIKSSTIESVKAELPECTSFKCSECPWLESVPAELPKCERFNCSCCPKLKSVPAELPKCESFNCSECPWLESVPAELPKCESFNCSCCPWLESVPDKLPKCERFNCSYCPKLKSVPAELPKCESFNCSNCPELESVPAELPKCESFNCEYCPWLESVPAELPKCKRFNCSCCRRLKSVPRELPVCTDFNYRNCPNIQITPEVPWNCQIYSDSTDVSRLTINMADFKNNPKKLLLALGDVLLNGNPFPQIGYVNSPAIDVGGVRRDFITRLFRSLFSKGKVETHLRISPDGLPSSDDSEDTRKALRTIARVFALCCSKNSYFKIGNVFPEKFFELLTTMKHVAQIELNDQNRVEDLQVFMRMPNEILQIFEGVQDVNDTNLDLLLDAFMPEKIDDPRKFLNEEKNRERLIKEMVNEEKKRPEINALRIIAQELKKKLGGDQWKRLIDEGGVTMNKRIQGELSAKKLKEKIIWIEHTQAHNDDKEKTKGYINTWITSVEKEKLGDFVFFVTGNRTLSSEPIKIEINNLDSNRLPVGHTCAFLLEIPGTYPDQETFNKKLEKAINDGSDMQIA